MEVTFTITLGITLIALLVTFLILLKGTRNFVYRTIGLGCFFVLLVTISYGYLELMGMPKPLTYESWYFEEGDEKQDGEGKGSEQGQEGFGSVLNMDIIEWEYDPIKGEAYLWMRKDKAEEREPAKNYSFDTTTEAGKKLLKQLQQAAAEAKRRGLVGHSRRGSGIKLKIIIDRLLMADEERFEFFIPPPKLLPPKTTPPPGTYYPNTSGPNPNARPHPGAARSQYPGEF